MAPAFSRKPAAVWQYAALFAAALAICTGCGVNITMEQGPQPTGGAESAVPHTEAAPNAARSSSPARTLEKTFDDIKFDIEKGESFDRSMLNDQVKDLFGERIRIRGYIFPTFRSKGIKQFVLVRDNQECCFGPGAALYDCIRVTMEEGESIEYTRSPVAVEGVFTLEEQFIDPERSVGAVFHMKDAAVN